MTKEEFVLSNKKLVIEIAKYYYGICEQFGIEFEDLLQIGYLALLEKYKNFNENKGKASTYAGYVIKTAIINYINSNKTITTVPNNFSYFANFVEIKNLDFYKANGRYMTKEELLNMISETKNVKYKKNENLLEKILDLNKYHLKTEQISLDTLIDEEAGDTFLDYIRTGYDMENSVISKMNCEDILASITDETINYDIVAETLGLNDGIMKTRKELAEQYGISCQRVDQKYKKSLEKIKEKINF